MDFLQWLLAWSHGALVRGCLAVLGIVLLLMGCAKDYSGTDVRSGEVVIGFRSGMLTVSGSSSGMNGGWHAFGTKGCSLVSGAATRAEVPQAPASGPEVENAEALPEGTTFRVLVYEAGANPQESIPVDENTYKVDANGSIVATAVDERGNATDGDTREIVLRRGAYDFYYFSPAVAANTAMPDAGTYIGLVNGSDYMALAQRQEVDPSKGPKHYIPEVCFYRMCSYIDVRISPRAGEVMGTLEVTGDGLQLWGLPSSGRYEIGEYPYRLDTEGDNGQVTFPAANFDSEAGAVATVSTVGCRGGRAVLPGYTGGLNVTVTLTSDGKQMKLGTSLKGYVFAPGYRYVVELGVGRIADKPELSIEILPWNEYDWSGDIGGGYISSATVTPAGDIPGEGKTYSLTLNGVLPSEGVDVRANIEGADPVMGKVSASGAAVSLAVPRNATGAERTVTFEYKWKGVWTQIGENRSQAVAPPAVGDLYRGEVICWVNPADANDIRVVALTDAPSKLAWAASTSFVLGSGAQDKSARNGADVWKIAKQYSDGKTNGATGTFATDFPAFSYCYEKTDGGVPKGTWYLPSVQELKDLYAVKGTVEAVITSNGGSALSADGYWSAIEYSGSNSYARTVSFRNGASLTSSKTSSYYVRCVRGR